jgi:hypothetical protein
MCAQIRLLPHNFQFRFEWSSPSSAGLFVGLIFHLKPPGVVCENAPRVLDLYQQLSKRVRFSAAPEIKLTDGESTLRDWSLFCYPSCAASVKTLQSAHSEMPSGRFVYRFEVENRSRTKLPNTAQNHDVRRS